MMLAKSLQSAAGNAAAEANYIEDVFSTYLYTGNGSTQTITNGIDLAGEGGLVWLKDRVDGASFHALYDTARGVSNRLSTNATSAQSFVPGVTAFNSNGFSLGATYNALNNTFASWTFRKQPKFFDVVTWVGTGSARTVAHSLGSVPGCILVKKTSTTGDWNVYHRSTGAGQYLRLNTTAAAAVSSANWNDTAPTSTEFTVGTGNNTNAAGETFVAYLFAHDAGGFGESGEDNVISCGSYTTDSSGNATVNLGYEPQWVILKHSSTTSGWTMFDTMRGWANSSANDPFLQANTSNAENSSVNNFGHPTATGFEITNFSGSVTGIYIAIRRGPMKVPESGTSVFAPVFASSSGPYTATAGFPVDLNFYGNKSNTDKWFWFDRLRGNPFLQSNATSAESASTGKFDSNTAFSLTATGDFSSFINYALRRAPGFFDEVCYTGTGSARTVAHNLTVVPEMMIVKSRSTVNAWTVYTAATGNTKFLYLDSTGSANTNSTVWNNTSPTSSVFTVGTSTSTNDSGVTYVSYLFSTVAGVSKVGSYTGTGTTLQIDCGFTGGARFVLIKRTSAVGDWYVWDAARGIVAGNDPFLFLNSTAAENTSTDYIDTYSAGFEISSTAPVTINGSGGSFIFFAVA